MYKSEIKQFIILNNKKLHKLIKVNPLLKDRLIGWVKHEIPIENKVLFPKDLYKNNYELQKEMDYTNIVNQAKAFDYITDKNNLYKKIDIFEIMNIHRILSEKTEDNKGGILRTKLVMANKLNICPPQHEFITYKLDDIVYNLEQKSKDIPLEIAIQTHYDLLALQPFNDLNKRTARIIMNWILLQNDFCPVVFNKNSDNNGYRDAIKNYELKYSEFMLSSILRTSNEMLKILRR